jgi:hypothetical protein
LLSRQYKTNSATCCWANFKSMLASFNTSKTSLLGCQLSGIR